MTRLGNNSGDSFRNYGTYQPGTGGNWVVDRMQRLEPLRRCHTRFQGVIIRSLDFRECIRIYGNKNTLIYADPPYRFETRKGGKLYQNEFTEKDHEDLLTLLIAYPGPMVVSHYLDQNYQALELHGFKRKEFPVMDDGKNKRIECIWIRP
jgi:DNA adenine methylase